jgi:glycosyltransferase involved in cell wall biosynthesis
MGSGMLSRKKIGMPFLGDYKTWAGGVIYTINILSALKTLPDTQKPIIYVYHLPHSPTEDLKAIEYPYIKFFCFDKQPNIILKLINYVSIKFFSKSILFNAIPDVCYPAWRLLPVGQKSINWIPDFQERYLPDLFSKDEINIRKKSQLNLSKTTDIVVFSSKDAQNDFKKFYPNYKNQLKLLSFASTLPDFEQLNIVELKEKYNLKKIYFFSPNQFWQHKNHLVILKAIAYLKPKNLDFQVVFSGSENDYRNKNYIKEIKDFVTDNKIEQWVCFLGFIDRKEQLQLMNNAIAIIQPSLFEGWSTVVEDAKAMSQFIILSNLKVHQEQITQNCIFFDPNDALYLADIIEKSVQHPLNRLNIDYQKNIAQFAETFLNVVSY